MWSPSSSVAVLITVVILSGCVEDGKEYATPMAQLVVTTVQGNLTVSYVVSDAMNGSQATATLEFGDGNSTTFGILPATGAYVYAAAGEYEVVATLKGPGGESRTNSTVIVQAVTVQTEYSSGPVLGCASDAGFQACPAYVRGPTDSDGLGLWIPIEPGHVGMQYTTSASSTRRDTDGWQFDADLKLVSDDANVAMPAMGIIDPDTAWVLVVSWAEPADKITAKFSLAPPEDEEAR